MTDNTIKPFEDDATALTLGELSIENGTQAIAIHGSLDLTRDRDGLEKARLLAELFSAAVRIMEQEGDHLPERIDDATDGEGVVDKPFG